ncbi:hypothetical protein HXX76_006844 [Chlamydomonas incerta]|uniref:DUF7906 domain-containing protein n=1 Tax=Chlamydomonas incerta TaxID=51695 RepID=A0A835W029_CHLIN|nr:hypothetical protein HXX76_006844 [Chlamydomonas incerta]|eukprot:KAG2435642.1 hypothetical protein HXX76_006844 [Chlamydomonas incerta]
MGEDALSWDNLELARLRNLHGRNFDSAEEFLGNSTLAEYLGLHQIQSLHMPVPLNVVLVGFAGDGNGGVNVSQHELNEWFQHLDHVLPHTRIDRSELTCQEDGQCAGLVHGRFHPTPMPSHVHLNFTCNVVLVKRRNVVDAFERAIAAFSRPVDPSVATGLQQVDAGKMEAFVDHFVGGLGLEGSYSLIVLNPTWHVDEPVYGYRMGVSAEELQVLKGQADRLRNVMGAIRSPEPVLPGHAHSSSWNGHAWPYGNSVAGKFAQKDATWDSERWVGAVGSYIRQEEMWRRGLLEAAGKERGGSALVQAARLLSRPGSFMGGILRKDLLDPWDEAAEQVHSTFHSSHPAEDCLVNTWVGSAGRWLLVDLTAGGKDWGPALGGDGVVHHGTLPKIHELFGEVKRKKEHVRQNAQHPGSTELQLHEALSQARAARIPSVANRHHHSWLLKRQGARRAAAAPGAPALDPVSKQQEEEEERAWRVQHQIVLLQAELDLLEEWALRYCNGQEHPPLACGTWKDETVALRSGLSKLHGAAGAEATYELFRDHKWEIFGGERDMVEIDPSLYDEEEISRDTLLGELAGVLSRAIRHVVAPPTAAWLSRRVVAAPSPSAALPTDAHTHAPAYSPRHTTAPPFAYQVNFQIYLISDNTRQLQNNNNPGSTPVSASFDVEAYKAAVDTLRMYNQNFKFSVSHMALHDNPSLAAALAAATRTTLQEVPSSEDFFDAEMERVYVDSRELADVLRRHFPPTKHQLRQIEAKAGRAQRITLTSPIRDVPVYVLQLARDVAVLLDEHYNARALDDMVLVVANSARRDEHPTGMMCGGNLVARPISPLKEALAATLLHLGGVLPPHLGYNPRAHAVTHDWLWSVGAHPLSFTSTGLGYTVFQKDALARSYLLDALDTSVEAVNAAVAQLARAKTSAKMWTHIKSHQTGARDLLRKFGDVVAVWRSAASMAYSLDFTTALEYVRTLEGDVNSLSIHAFVVSNMAEPVRCATHVVDRVGLLVPVTYVGSAAVTLLALLYAVLPKIMRSKAKAM